MVTKQGMIVKSHFQKYASALKSFKTAPVRDVTLFEKRRFI